MLLICPRLLFKIRLEIDLARKVGVEVHCLGLVSFRMDTHEKGRGYGDDTLIANYFTIYKSDFTAPNVEVQAGEDTTQVRGFSPPDKLRFSAT